MPFIIYFPIISNHFDDTYNFNVALKYFQTLLIQLYCIISDRLFVRCYTSLDRCRFVTDESSIPFIESGTWIYFIHWSH